MVIIGRRILWALCLFTPFVLPSLVSAEKVYTSIESIRKLSINAASQGRPVRLRGQIRWLNETNGHLFLFQEAKPNQAERGIYVRWAEDWEGTPQELKLGQTIVLTGITHEGDFTTCVVGQKIEKLGKVAQIPQAASLHYSHLSSPMSDCGWYSVKGRIDSMEVYQDHPPGGSILLRVEMNDMLIPVIFPLSDEGLRRARHLLFSRIRVDAVAATKANANRQIVSRVFYANSLQRCEVLSEWRPAEGVAIKAPHRLGRAGSNLRGIIGTEGIVTHVDGDQLYLRGEHTSIRATIRDDEAVPVGERVQLIGFTVPDSLSPSFLAKEIRVIDSGPPPQPKTIQLDQQQLLRWSEAHDASLNFELVQVEAELIEITESLRSVTGDREHALLCRQGKHLFRVVLPFDPATNSKLRPGAVIRVNGICNLIRNTEQGWRVFVDWFWIQARNQADIAVLKTAPWWTTTRLLWLLALVLSVAILSILWNLTLRRTVERQTRIIAAQIEQESIQEERRRIAQELHDTLEQSLAALGMFLKVSQNQLKDASEKARETVAKAIGMQRSCAEQSRAAIVELRDHQEQVSLLARIENFINELPQQEHTEVQFNSDGEQAQLSRLDAYYLYRICVEAVTNSLKHAQATTLSIQISFTAETIRLHIQDDGIGFDPQRLSTIDRYGLVGMRERAKRIKADLRITSQPNQGTTISLNLPLS
ncbi:histidine kinase [Coraliomargarita akajimensis DSM 45221]|uniref:Histidine kinase n=2 Tax=Coraliomargarita TaxID=442430 RepID=D5EIL8_CORAD|nr:histidine kinase [Coraliomargarita akajimensis DSM 45221]